MPKNKGKGGKNRRRGKNESDVLKRELQQKDVGQEYAQVLKMLGNGRLTAFCFDGKMRLCHIRGKLRKKVWINTGDIVLIGLRDYQDDKADVILKYNTDEARSLKQSGELPENAKLNEGGEEGDEDVDFSMDVGAGSGEEGGDSDSDNMPSSDDDEEDTDKEEEEEDDDDDDDDDDTDKEEEDDDDEDEDQGKKGRIMEPSAIRNKPSNKSRAYGKRR